MSKQYCKVKGHNEYVRDTSSKAIINTDENAWLRYKHRRRIEKSKDETINSLKNEMESLKVIIAELSKQISEKTQKQNPH